MTDQANLEGLRQGLEAAFDAIFRTYYANLVGFADSILKDRGAAEDTAQDVMVELWRRRSSIVLQTSLRAYLFQATRNRALNHLRHRRVVARVTPADLTMTQPSASDRGLLEGEIGGRLREAVAALPERCREVFTLSRDRGLSYAEIAEALGISIKTVEGQMGKALKLLRAELAPWLPAGDEP